MELAPTCSSGCASPRRVRGRACRGLRDLAKRLGLAQRSGCCASASAWRCAREGFYSLAMGRTRWLRAKAEDFSGVPLDYRLVVRGRPVAAPLGEQSRRTRRANSRLSLRPRPTNAHARGHGVLRNCQKAGSQGRWRAPVVARAPDRHERRAVCTAMGIPLRAAPTALELRGGARSIQRRAQPSGLLA